MTDNDADLSIMAHLDIAKKEVEIISSPAIILVDNVEISGKSEMVSVYTVD